MVSDNRSKNNAVVPALLEASDAIRTYDFVAAVRLLENAQTKKPRIGEATRYAEEIVRLSQNANLGFQGSALHAFMPSDGSKHDQLYVNFFGLLGSNGPLPFHYTEYADQRRRHHSDATFSEFIDLFNHRMLSLFYRASIQFDPAVNFDRSDDNEYYEVLGALCGMSAQASSGRDVLSDCIKRFYPGWFTDTAKSPDGIKSLISDYFNLPVTIIEFVGAWLPLPAESRVRIGSREQSACLGRSTYLGRRAWSIKHKFIVELGPLGWEEFRSFSPGSKRNRALHDIVRNYIGDEWDWDLQLVLRKTETPRMSLGHARRLGFDSWLSTTTGRAVKHRKVLISKLHVSQSPS